MNIAVINTARRWREMSHTILSSEEISFRKIQNLLRDTYEILTEFHKDELIPKEISEMISAMDECMNFMSTSEEGYIDFRSYERIFSTVSSMKHGFFEGKYECAFPELKIKIYDIEKKSIIINFETSIFDI